EPAESRSEIGQRPVPMVWIKCAIVDGANQVRQDLERDRVVYPAPLRIEALRDIEMVRLGRQANLAMGKTSCLPGWRSADMPKSLSRDLRTRVLAAISSGLSCRQAALRFGVSASSAIRWRTMERGQGDATPKAVGGDRRSMRIDRHAG